MKFRYTNLETCSKETGMAVVIDIIRAFTDAAFAFSRGTLDYCSNIDAFDFVMPSAKENGRPVMRAIKP
jgi:hypothetical protein